jgi:hypothetical protein
VLYLKLRDDPPTVQTLTLAGLIGINEQLGNGPGSRIGLEGCDGRGRALCCTDKIFDTGIGNYISHKDVPRSLRQISFCAAYSKFTCSRPHAFVTRITSTEEST